MANKSNPLQTKVLHLLETMTGRELAKKLRVSPSTITRWKKGERTDAALAGMRLERL